MSVLVGCADTDGDGVCNDADNCPGTSNANQADSDGDGAGDACDACPLDFFNDADADGVCGNVDNCPGVSNANQADADGDTIGDACDQCTDADQDFSCSDVDCNDNNASINPNADELCDNADNDCNQNTADGVDEPGYGDQTNCGFGECASVGVFTCVNGNMADTCQPGPPAIETCDGLDNDCNNVIDNGALLTFFQDFDVDTYGNPIIIQQACQAPQGYVANDDDCDDNNLSINPAAAEICDQVDNNCNGQIDEGNVCDGGCQDQDQDEVCDNEDLCDGFPNVDNDGDGICNSEDECPDDAANDNDNDNVCDGIDECPGFDDSQDTDGDGTPDGCDACPNDEFNDIDGDTLCGDIDECPANPENDADNDGQCEDIDLCPIDPDNDADGDGVCGDVDACPLDNPDDSDSDGACDTDDLCPGFDDSLDSDEDGTPDGCDEDVEVFEGSVTLFNGWTLFALPLNPAILGIDNSEELGQAIIDSGINCDVIEKFNGDTQLWQDDLLGLPDPSFSLAGGVGYFIHCYGGGVFNYQGTVWT